MTNKKKLHPQCPEEHIDHIRHAFAHSLMKSMCTSARQLELLHLTVHKVLHKNLTLYDYKMQMLQAHEQND